MKSEPATIAPHRLPSEDSSGAPDEEPPSASPSMRAAPVSVKYGPWPAARAPELERAGRIGSWHLPAGQSLRNFCETLDDRGVAYAVIGARASTDESEPTELLIKDEHVPRIGDLITRVPLGQRLAVYSTIGRPGFSFQQRWRRIHDGTNMALLPSHLAEALIDRARPDEAGIRVPPPKDTLLWEIFRALYLAGDTHFAVSSLDEQSPVLLGPSAQIISTLARETGANLAEPLTLEALDQHLLASGWEPPFDLLRRLSGWNSWAALKVAEVDARDASEAPGMAVFFIRREAVACRLDSAIAQLLEATGFELLKTIDLTAEQVASATRSFRGGDWGAGGFPVGGGPPVRLVVAFDVLPQAFPEQMRTLYPHMDNGRILRVKQVCREFIERRMPGKLRFNPMHSTDTSGEAWRVVRMFAQEEEQRFRELIQSRNDAMATHFEVVRDLTRKGDRAKIEVIRYQDGLAVKKTFREGCLQYLDREASFMSAVSQERPEILPVLERGRNYFIMPFVDGPPLRKFFGGRGFPKLMTLKQVRDLADLMKFLFSRGYDLVDFAPYNLLVEHSGELRAIDFEWVHRTDVPVKPETSACLSGIKEDFAGEWTPAALWDRKRYHTDPYNQLWFGHTGLTLSSFLYGPAPLQRMQRLVNRPYFLARKTAQRGKQIVWNWARHTVRRRLPVLSRMASQLSRSRAR